MKTENDFTKINNNFFEDENYIVNKSCSGEFGGTIKFLNKKTGIEYSCSSSCPVIVNKLNSNYYVTNSLAHLSGFTEILEIKNPEDLTVFKMPKPRKKKGKMIYRLVGDDESKSTTGSKTLVDSVGIVTLISFPFQGMLLHVITDFNKTYLAKVENNIFVNIGIISNDSLWSYEQNIIKTKDNHFIYMFGGQKAKGYLDISNNNIEITRCR